MGPKVVKPHDLLGSFTLDFNVGMYQWPAKNPSNLLINDQESAVIWTQRYTRIVPHFTQKCKLNYICFAQEFQEKLNENKLLSLPENTFRFRPRK